MRRKTINRNYIGTTLVAVRFYFKDRVVEFPLPLRERVRERGYKKIKDLNHPPLTPLIKGRELSLSL